MRQKSSYCIADENDVARDRSKSIERRAAVVKTTRSYSGNLTWRTVSDPELGGGYRDATEELELGRVTRSDLGRVKFIVSKS